MLFGFDLGLSYTTLGLKTIRD